MSMEDALDKIAFEAEKAYEDVRNARYDANLKKETFNDNVKIVEQEAINAGLRNVFTREQINLTKAQQNEISQKILNLKGELEQGWENLDQNATKIEIQKFVEELKSEYPNITNVGGRLANELTRGLQYIMLNMTGHRKYDYHRKIGE